MEEVQANGKQTFLIILVGVLVVFVVIVAIWIFGGREEDVNCVKEGQYIPVMQPSPNCCKGLKKVQLTEEEKEIDGISAKCVKKKFILF